MRRFVMWVIPILALAPALAAAEPPKDPPKDKPKADKAATAAEQLQTLQKELQKLGQEAQKQFNEAKTPEEKQKIRDEYFKKLKEYAPRFLEIAEKNPKDDAAFEALGFVLNAAQGTPTADKAIDLLLKDHIKSKRMGQFCAFLGMSGSPGAEKVLRAVMEKNPEKEVKVQATLSLGQMLKQKTETPGTKKADIEKLSKEAETLLASIEKDFPDANAQILEQAKVDLFELRNLAIGKTIPEVEGEDADGKKFKLSDYRGKVVVLDFWAEW